MYCLTDNQVNEQHKYKTNKDIYAISTGVIGFFIIIFIILIYIGFRKVKIHNNFRTYSQNIGITGIVLTVIFLGLICFTGYEIYYNQSKIEKNYIRCNDLTSIIKQENAEKNKKIGGELNGKPVINGSINNNISGSKEAVSAMASNNATNVGVSGTSGDVSIPEAQIINSTMNTNAGDFVNPDLNGTDSMFLDSSQDIDSTQDKEAIETKKSTTITTNNQSAMQDNQKLDDPSSVIQTTQGNATTSSGQVNY